MTADATVVRNLYDARSRNDLAAAAEAIAPNVVWHEPYDYLGTLNGREAVMDAIQQSMEETHGTFHLDVTDLLSSEDHVVALVDFSAERNGPACSGARSVSSRSTGGSFRKSGSTRRRIQMPSRSSCGDRFSSWRIAPGRTWRGLRWPGCAR